MTWLKKINPDWNPQEHPGILVGDVVDFPGNIEKLVQEGNVVLCDKDGNEISTYDATGILTEREMNEFKAWRQLQQQTALKKSLESEHDELLAQAEALKSKTIATPSVEKPTGTVEDAKAELEVKKRDFAAKMAAAKAKKAAERAAAEAQA